MLVLAGFSSRQRAESQDSLRQDTRIRHAQGTPAQDKSGTAVSAGRGRGRWRGALGMSRLSMWRWSVFDRRKHLGVRHRRGGSISPSHPAGGPCRRTHAPRPAGEIGTRQVVCPPKPLPSPELRDIAVVKCTAAVGPRISLSTFNPGRSPPHRHYPPPMPQRQSIRFGKPGNAHRW